MPLAHPINSLKISTLKTGCFLEEMADDSDNIIKKSAEKSHQPAAHQICPGPIKFSLCSSTAWPGTCGSQDHSHCRDSVVAYRSTEWKKCLRVRHCSRLVTEEIFKITLHKQKALTQNSNFSTWIFRIAICLLCAKASMFCFSNAGPFIVIAGAAHTAKSPLSNWQFHSLRIKIGSF